jgi:3-oxoacyl-[acyl-carrier-protein] synthase II
MSAAAIVAYGAVSALGEGANAASAGEVGARARVAIAKDHALVAAGFARPFVARVRDGIAVAAVDRRDRADVLLARALSACAIELDRSVPDWRARRVGLVLGTSSGAMESAERAFDRHASGLPPLGEPPTYFAPMRNVLRAATDLVPTFQPSVLILGACASSTLAIGLGARYLAAGACDVVLAGGFDAVSVFVAAGFEILRATSAEVPPRPFRTARDGMALGEGAAVLAMMRPSDAPRAHAYIAGFAATADAVHLTAPDRTGGGVARAGVAALRESCVASEDVALVSAHATATPFNDPAEARAIATILGPEHGSRVAVHPFKAQIGHTLGAAGALELLACVDALERGVLPAAAGEGAIDPDARVALLDVTAAASPRAALKLSSAFGGANAALVVTRDAPPSTRAHVPSRRASYVSKAVRVASESHDLASRLRMTPDRLARADLLTRLALDAVARLVEAHGDLAGAGVVVGQAYATLETNLLFHARLRDRGVRMAEPRRFPYTSPNAVAGECSLAFNLTGSSFAVGSGTHAALEALAVASLLVSSGDAERVVVVATDEVGAFVGALDPDARQGAVATLVSASARGARARITSVVLRAGLCDRVPCVAPRLVGHRALLPLVDATGPARLDASSGTACAHVTLEPVRDDASEA